VKPKESKLKAETVAQEDNEEYEPTEAEVMAYMQYMKQQREEEEEQQTRNQQVAYY
jgi:hypothetical protein